MRRRWAPRPSAIRQVRAAGVAREKSQPNAEANPGVTDHAHRFSGANASEIARSGLCEPSGLRRRRWDLTVPLRQEIHWVPVVSVRFHVMLSVRSDVGAAKPQSPPHHRLVVIAI